MPSSKRSTSENAFAKEDVLDVARRAIDHTLCDHCVGRQLAHVSTGMTNKDRGIRVRTLLKSKEPKTCSVCGGLFTRLDAYAKEAIGLLKGVEYKTFVVTTRLSPDLVTKEEQLWEEIGIEWCEPLRSELNREFGKLLQKLLKKTADEKNPDVQVVLNLQKNAIEIMRQPLYIAGAYQKLVRGIPQTVWEGHPETVQSLIATPLREASASLGDAFHGAGREDLDALCLDWRPFVIELIAPQKRDLPLRVLEKKINQTGKVRVQGLIVVRKEEILRVKSLRGDKTYRLLVQTERALQKKDLLPLKTLVGIIQQKTPVRVMGRRGDILRKRKVKSLVSSYKDPHTIELTIRGEAGLYVKELVTGDGGRTTPSVSQHLGPCMVRELDVIKIHTR